MDVDRSADGGRDVHESVAGVAGKDVDHLQAVPGGAELLVIGGHHGIAVGFRPVNVDEAGLDEQGVVVGDPDRFDDGVIEGGPGDGRGG